MLLPSVMTKEPLGVPTSPAQESHGVSKRPPQHFVNFLMIRIRMTATLSFLLSHGVSKGPQNDVNFLMIRMTCGLKHYILLQKTAAGIASAVHFATLAGLSFHGRSKDIAVLSFRLQWKVLLLAVLELCRVHFCTQLDTHAYTCVHKHTAHALQAMPRLMPFRSFNRVALVQKGVYIMYIVHNVRHTHTHVIYMCILHVYVHNMDMFVSGLKTLLNPLVLLNLDFGVSIHRGSPHTHTLWNDHFKYLGKSKPLLID